MNHSLKSGSIGLRIAPPLAVSACYGLLAALPDLRTGTPEMLAVTGMATVVIAVILYRIENDRARWSPALILILAACFRLLFLLQEPELSDDIHRYLFDGIRLSMGANPYDMSPEQAGLESDGMAELAAKVNHSDLVTIYPPTAQIIFAAGALLGGGIVGIKIVLIGIDLLYIFLMMRLLTALSLPSDRAILYAWHPLAVLEVASSGHIDGAAVMFVLAAMCLLLPAPISHVPRASTRTGKPAVFAAGVLFAAAVLIKLFPVVFLPLLLFVTRTHRKRFFLAGLALAGVLLVLPFYPDIRNALTTLGLYTTTWEFSSLAFRLLKNLFDSGFLARVVLGAFFTAFWAVCFRWAVSGRYRPVPTVDLFQRTLQACYFISFGFLLVTPTLHPWYGLYMLALLPFAPGPAGLMLSWTVLLGYRVLIPYAILGQWIESDWVPILIWSGPSAAWLLCLCARNRETGRVTGKTV